MKTAIIYQSRYNGNTRRLAEVFAASSGGDLIDASRFPAGKAEALELDGSSASLDAERYAALDQAELLRMGRSFLRYFLSDELVSRYRRMLDIQRHSNAQAARLFHRQYVALPLAYQAEVFSRLIERGILKPLDPAVMALHFYAPLYLLLTACDGEQDTAGHVEDHIRQFMLVYGNQEGEKE